MFGIAGFAAATDCFYFAVMAEYFMDAGYNFESAVNNTAYTADHSDSAQTAKSLFIFNILCFYDHEIKIGSLIF
jgi:hypothetical protein